MVDAEEFLAANEQAKAEGKRPATYKPLHYYANEDEALMAYNEGVIGPHCPIGVRVTRTIDGVEQSKVVEVTPGRIIFNHNLPQDQG